MAGGVFGMVRSAVSAGQAFAEPVVSNGTTIIAAARVYGGGGGATGADGSADGGLGLVAKPAGAFVIQDGKVRWVPAVDVNRLIVIAVIFFALIVIRQARRRRRRMTAAAPKVLPE